jgi:O-antigen/teichoic acid export membrane protein
MNRGLVNKMIRSIISIIGGYVSFSIAVLILWLAFGYGPKDVPPPAFLMFSIFCEVFFAVGSGYLVAIIAQRRELLHAAILAAIFVIIGLGSLIFKTHQYPYWVALSIIFINAPCALLGGYIRQNTKRKTSFTNPETEDG